METKNKTVFIEYSSNAPGQHFMTVMGYVNGQRRIIGKIFKEYDTENKKMVYNAINANNNSVFSEVPDLMTLKKRFIEHNQTLTQFIPKETEHRETELPELEERENDLKQIREQKADKQQERKPER